MYGVDSFASRDASGHHYAPNNHHVMAQFKARHAFDNVHVIVGDFAAVAQRWAQPVDILHIDGTHTLVQSTCSGF